MSLSKFFLFSFLIFGIAALNRASDYNNNLLNFRCRHHSTQEVEDTGECPHGAERNSCGKLVCLKGVGEKCGEGYSGGLLYGNCASGLMCCGICTGCRHGNCNRELCRPKRPSLSHVYNTFDFDNY